MLNTIDSGIIFAYLALMIAIGVYASRKQDSVEDFFVAGGSLGTFSIACLWLASWVGGAAIVGGAAKTYQFGVSGGWYIICMALGCLLFGLFFAAQVKRWGKERQLLTYPGFIEARYDSRTRIVATITTIAAFWSMTLSLITVIAWYIGARLDLAPVFSIDPLWPGLLVSVALFAGISFFADAAE